MSETSNPSRRRFLATVTTGAAVVGAAGCEDDFGGVDAEFLDSAVSGPVMTGPVSSYSVGRFRRSSRSTFGGAFIVGRDDRGFFAFSNRCTHSGCALPVPTGGDGGGGGTISCPCHTSVYDSNGDLIVRRVSNQTNLEHYFVSFDGTGPTAQVVVDPRMVLSDRNTRVAPPA